MNRRAFLLGVAAAALVRPTLTPTYRYIKVYGVDAFNKIIVEEIPVPYPSSRELAAAFKEVKEIIAANIMNEGKDAPDRRWVEEDIQGETAGALAID